MTYRGLYPSRARTALVGTALAAALTLAPVLPTGTLAPTATAAPVARVAAAAAAAKAHAAPLRVASFNVRNANDNDHHKNEKPWTTRRTVIVKEVLGQHLDVLAVQEASQGLLHDAASRSAGTSQFDDLVARLGGSWQVTNDNHYNCVRSASPNNCDYAYNGASEGNRILFDASRVKLVAQGSKKLPVPKGKGDNYMAWAEFVQRSTGKHFMFSNLHTVGTDKDYKIKVRQAKGALAAMKANNPDHLPMIAVGDWNSSRFEKPSNGPYDVYRKAGFVDPLGGAYKTHKPKHPTVEHTVRAWLNSSNPGWSRKAPNHKSWKLGSYIDYIMTTKMRVSEWETVARLDKKGRFVGTIPSDHNMVRATVWLP